jgi:pentatricopeptide repeat protein
MIQSGENSGVATYGGSLLHGYATKGDLVEMNNLIGLMVQNAMQPNHHIFNIQIYEYGKCGRSDEAMLTFNKMRQQGLMPNIINYGTIIDGLCKIGQLDDAMSQFCGMMDDGLSPDISIDNFNSWFFYVRLIGEG